MVLSTNIAETSLTIEDVVYVVDSGKLKVSLPNSSVLYSIGQYLRPSSYKHGPWYTLLSKLTALCILPGCGLTSAVYPQ